MAEEFDLLTADDKASAAYAVCVGGWVAAGLMVGGAAGGVGAPAGAVGGAVWAKMTCPAIVRKYKQIIQRKQMKDGDFSAMMNDFQREYPGKGRKELLAIAGMFASGIAAGRYEANFDESRTMLA